MKKNKNNNYYNLIDFLRVLSCIAILLYHMNILKGGYLAVCTFFTLTGYLSIISASKKEKFSLKDYYLNKLKKIYLPLLLVVFITIAITSFIHNLGWYNLKPETISVLLNYNNYWQLSANLDYFTRNINSPFTHLWYMSIVIEYYLAFPLLYILIKKIGEKTKKYLPCIILGLSTFASYILFYKLALNSNIMQAYYDTFARLFSILSGLLLGYIHINYKHLIPKIITTKNLNIFIFSFYSVFLILLFILIDVKSPYFTISMLLTTLISIRLIDYGTYNSKNELSPFDKIINLISKISYEVYLIQYPVIFLFQNINLDYYLKIAIIITIIFITSFIINYSIDYKNQKRRILKIIMTIIIAIPSIFGIYKFIIAKDHTSEMKALEEQLAKNSQLTKDKQKEFLENSKKAAEDWEQTLLNFENDEKNLKEYITNLNIVGVGDSIMLGAINELYSVFPKGYFDAAVNRTDWEANDILINLKNRGMLSDIILFNLGTNGECSQECKNQIYKTIGSRKVFWVNATKPDFPIFNTNLKKVAETHDNIHIVDWINASKGHPEFFVADGIHLTKSGGNAYAKTIYDTIYNYYLNDLKAQKENKIKSHELAEKNKITFIGNDMLLNAYELLQKNYNGEEFIIDKFTTYESLKNTLTNKINDKTLSYNVVLIVDNSLKLKKKDYENLSKICTDHMIYLIAMDDTKDIKYDNLVVLDYNGLIKENNNYLMVDKQHLTLDGNIALVNLINDNLHVNENE